MNKTFCDSCDKEVEMTDKNISIFGYSKYTHVPNEGLKPVMVKEDYCGDCSGKIQSEIQKIKDGNRKNIQQTSSNDK